MPKTAEQKQDDQSVKLLDTNDNGKYGWSECGGAI